MATLTKYRYDKALVKKSILGNMESERFLFEPNYYAFFTWKKRWFLMIFSVSAIATALFQKAAV